MTMPSITPIDSTTERWRLTEDYAGEICGYQFVVPCGFITDGASIPRILWRLCGHPLSTKRFPAALVHDWLYSGNVPCTREFADGIYRDGLVALGFPRWKANLEYYTLRLFGGSHWKGENQENG